MIAELVRAVRERRVTACDLVEAAVDRIARLNPALNAVVALREEKALREAAALDRRGAAEDLPLAGVPFLVKDLEDLAGLRTTLGSRLFADAPPAGADGVIAARLRAAGAIPVGKTNTPEFATEGFTANLVFGVTRNPWGARWSPGGSSGGSGAAVAAGMVPVATATDTGGSIRIPAAFCGLYGIKPTKGVVPGDPGLCWPDLTTCGPIGRSVADVRLLLTVEGDGARPGDAAPPVGRPRRAVAVERFAPWGPLPPAVSSAFEAALGEVEERLGLPVERADTEAVFGPNADTVDPDWFALAGPQLVMWLGRERVEAAMEDLHPATREFVEQGLLVSVEAYASAWERCAEYAAALDRVLGDDAVVVSPTVASEGWQAEGPLPGSDAPGPPPEVYNCAVQNLTGHPGLSMPAGRLPNGLPFGLHVTGLRFADRALLDLAVEWERAGHAFEPPPGHEPFGAELVSDA